MGTAKSENADILKGTLDVLILKALSGGPAHGYTIATWIASASGDALALGEGTLYPALHRLEARGWLRSRWGTSANNRQAKFYTLTRKGQKQLALETDTVAALCHRLVFGPGGAGARAVELRSVNRMFRRRSGPRRSVLTSSASSSFHLEMRVRELVARGVPPDEARRRAMEQFGDYEGSRARVPRHRRAARTPGVSTFVHPRLLAGPRLRGSRPAPIARVHGRRRHHARARHWRQQRHLQRRQRRPARVAAVPRRRAVCIGCARSTRTARRTRCRRRIS